APLRASALRWSSAALGERNPSARAISARVGGKPVRSTVTRMRSRISCWRSVSLVAMAMIRKADCMDIQRGFWTSAGENASAVQRERLRGLLHACGMAERRRRSGHAKSRRATKKGPSCRTGLAAERPGLLLDDRCDRVGDGVDVAAVQGRHADAAAGHSVNAVLLAQGVHLGGGQAGVREHAALLQHEAEVLLGACG